MLTQDSVDWRSQLDMRLMTVRHMARINELTLPEQLDEALNSIPTNNTDDPRVLRIIREFVNIVVDMLHEIGCTANRHSILKELVELPQEWHRDNESARAVAWKVASFRPEEIDDDRHVGQPMFTALMGVWHLLSVAYADNRTETGAEFSMEEIIARLALLIQLHRELAGTKMNDSAVSRLVEAINNPAKTTPSE